MLDNRSIAGRYVGLFLLGCFFFSYPVLTLFNREESLFGIPVFFFYLFAAWSVLIVSIIVFGKIPEPFHLSEPDNNKNKLKPPDLS